MLIGLLKMVEFLLYQQFCCERYVMICIIVEFVIKIVIIGFDELFCVIGEWINLMGCKKLVVEFEVGDFFIVEKDVLVQVVCGVNIFDINVGVVYNLNLNLNEIEFFLMWMIVELVQGLMDVLLCIDSLVFVVLEVGFEVVNGCFFLNLVMGEEE